MQLVKKAVEVGWVVDPAFAHFVFDAPQALKSERDKPLSNRAVQACPAVNELERRLFVITCPFNIELEVERESGAFSLYVVDEGTRLDEDLIGKYVMLMKPDLWREADRPVLQISIPYVFLCDEECYMTQCPPYLESKHYKWPGTLISGRFPIRDWPRVLNWAFEWEDVSKPLKLRRGQPLCYVYFETTKPSHPIKLVAAENTPELEKFRKGISGVPKFTSNTFKLMDVARLRRPKKLLKRMED